MSNLGDAVQMFAVQDEGDAMRCLGFKLCLFLFFAAVLAGRTNELGTLTGAITGTILVWPVYRRLGQRPVPRHPGELSRKGEQRHPPSNRDGGRSR